MSDDVEYPPLYLDPDLYDWLFDVAADRYGGNVEKAANIMLRVAMLVHRHPEDPWKGISYEVGPSGPGTMSRQFPYQRRKQ